MLYRLRGEIKMGLLAMWIGPAWLDTSDLDNYEVEDVWACKEKALPVLRGRTTRAKEKVAVDASHQFAKFYSV